MAHLVNSFLHPRELCVATGQGDVGQKFSSHSLVTLHRNEYEFENMYYCHFTLKKCYLKKCYLKKMLP